MKSIVMPWLARAISSPSVRKIKHVYAESISRLKGDWPCVEVYLHPEDPYSYLLLQTLPNLQSRYHIQIRIFWLNKLNDQMFPKPDLLRKYALRDCQYLAAQYQLKAPVTYQLEENQLLYVCCQLQSIADRKELSLTQVVAESLQQLNSFSNSEIVSAKSDAVIKTKIESNQRRLQKQGHFSPGMIYFAGEWYWGLDRLHFLESRLNEKGLQVAEVSLVFDKHLKLPAASKSLNNKQLTLYWSARSPYSYLALVQCIDLARQHQFALEIKPVMPMVMRNLAVPKAKKMYIFHDTKREAKRLGIDYGFVADPLGAAVIRCYSLLDYARSQNKYLEFLLSFSRAVNSMGIRAETDKGLKHIVEQAGLNWQTAQSQLKNESWKRETDRNLQQMTEKGLWGVPSIAYDNQMVWGQDRIPYIMQLMLVNEE